MKKIIFFTSLIIGLYSCSEKKVVFNKLTENSTRVELTLNDTAFIHIADSPEGVRFEENGKYKIEDSLLILDYHYDSYSYECYTIPLSADTFLISSLDNYIFLYPIKSNKKKKFNYSNIMESLVKIYNTKRIDFSFKSDFLWIDKSTFENKFGKRKYTISEYYDKKLKR